MSYSELLINAIANNLLDVVIAVITITVSYYVIPTIKDHLIPWLKDKHLYDVVYKAVLAAEKLAETNQIKKIDKKQYVLNLLRKKGIAINSEVEQLIETACEQIDLIESTTIDSIKGGDKNGKA